LGQYDGDCEGGGEQATEGVASLEEVRRGLRFILLLEHRLFKRNYEGNMDALLFHVDQ
jgi:hypothetical protein